MSNLTDFTEDMLQDFCNDGPVVLAMGAVRNYVELLVWLPEYDRISTVGLLRIWLDRNNPLVVRLAALRDFLRQLKADSLKCMPEMKRLYRAEEDDTVYPAVLNSGAWLQNLELFLSMDPRLLKEFSGEFCYLLEHYVRDNKVEGVEIPLMIELLLNYVNGETVERIWRYHPIAAGYFTVRELFAEAEGGRHLTDEAWVHQEAQEKVLAALQKQLEDMKANEQDAIEIDYRVADDSRDFLSAAVKAIKQEANYRNMRSNNFVKQLLELIVSHFPEESFFKGDDLIKVASWANGMQSTQTAMQLLRTATLRMDSEQVKDFYLGTEGNGVWLYFLAGWARVENDGELLERIGAVLPDEMKVLLEPAKN